VPAARGEAAEDRLLRGGVIQMKGLRVELRREAADALGIHAHARGAGVLLSGGVIFQVAHLSLIH